MPQGVSPRVMTLCLMHPVMPILFLPIAAGALASKISVTLQRGKHLIRRSLSLTSESTERRVLSAQTVTNQLALIGIAQRNPRVRR